MILIHNIVLSLVTARLGFYSDTFFKERIKHFDKKKNTRRSYQMKNLPAAPQVAQP